MEQMHNKIKLITKSLKLKVNIKHFAIIVLLVFTITIITGCSQYGSIEQYHVGTQGLVFDFSKANPKSVYEGEQFGTSLFVKNAGAYDLIDRANPGQLTITYDDYRLTFVQNAQSTPLTNIWLRGKSIYFPLGEEAPISFFFESKRLTHLREGATTSINYNLCFPYQTELTTMTCIDTKAANNDDSVSACQSTVYSGVTGQGAPIVITRIEPEILLQTDYVRPQFKIYIQNSGNGYVANTERCDLTNINDVETSGRVNILAWLSGELLDCGPDNMGQVRLVDGESYIKCSLPNDNNKYTRTAKSYITPLTIRLTYTYTLIEKQDLDIKRNDLLEPEVTQGMCNSYQLEVGGKCVTKCEYCATNADDSNCYITQSPVTTNAKAIFGPGFGCTCQLSDCNSKVKDGNCIKGPFCAGDLYCCSSNRCKVGQIEYQGTCIDKCQYCQYQPKDTRCVGLNLTGFECLIMSQIECNKYKTIGGCFDGLCGQSSDPTNTDTVYCANKDKIDNYYTINNLTQII